MSKKRKIAIVITAALTGLTLCFIWGNSFLGQSASGSGSGKVYVKIAKPVFDFLFGVNFVSHEAFRKIAHGAEFMLLGFNLCGLFAAINAGFNEKTYLKILPLGFYVAFLDETIQIFTGREPQIKDVWIDFGGYVAALALSFLVFVIVRAIKKKKNKKA